MHHKFPIMRSGLRVLAASARPFRRLSATCVLPAQLHQCIASGVSVCCLMFPSHNTRRPAQPASHRFLPDAAAMSPTLRLTYAESGHIISDSPERVRASSSHILHCEVACLPPFAAQGRWPKSGPVRQWRHKRNERAEAPGSKRHREELQPTGPGRRARAGNKASVLPAHHGNTRATRRSRRSQSVAERCLETVDGRPLRVKAARVSRKDMLLTSRFGAIPANTAYARGVPQRSSMRQAFHSSLHVSFKFLSLAAFGVCNAEAPLQNYGVSSESQS